MSNLYHDFVGIDIGKFEFVANIHGSKTTKTYSNDAEGISSFYKEFKAILYASLVVVEVTGG